MSPCNYPRPTYPQKSQDRSDNPPISEDPLLWWKRSCDFPYYNASCTQKYKLTFLCINRLVRCFKPRVHIVEGYQSHLNGIAQRVYRTGKILTTKLKVWRSIIGSNVCDQNTSPWWFSNTRCILIWFKSKVEEAHFDDKPTGNCDIPGTNAVCWEIVWKIWAGKYTTGSSEESSRWDTRLERITIQSEMKSSKPEHRRMLWSNNNNSSSSKLNRVLHDRFLYYTAVKNDPVHANYSIIQSNIS